MKFNIIATLAVMLILFSCSNSNQSNTTEIQCEGHEHESEEEAPIEDEHTHEEVKFKYTAYSTNFELFAEADAFVVGQESNILSHFSMLPSFKALEKGSVSISLLINNNQVGQTLDNPTRKGIYSFNLTPNIIGQGILRFEISNSYGTKDTIEIAITVFPNLHEASEASKAIVESLTNSSPFTKEQSWKIDFATSLPKVEPFGQIIKTTAIIQPAQSNEMVITAKTNGTVLLTDNKIIDGAEIQKGKTLLIISSNNYADNNHSVKYAEAKNNYDKAKSEYERTKELSNDKIVSEKELQTAKYQYNNAKAVYDNLNSNFNANGQTVSSPMNGYIKQLFVKNGTYVETGQPIATICQNNTLVLSANVPQKYASTLPFIQSANIRGANNTEAYTFEQLNGKILSYGKSANANSHLLPINIQIDNIGNFTPGSFVEIYLKALSNANAITIPATSIIEEQGIFFVWVQINPELFEKRVVHIGNNDGANIEITNGVLPTERVVTKGAMFIKLAQATGTLDPHAGHAH